MVATFAPYRAAQPSYGAAGMAQLVLVTFDNHGNTVLGDATVDGVAVDGGGISADITPGTTHAVRFHPGGQFQDVAFNFVPKPGFNPVFIACYPLGAAVPPLNALGAIQVHVHTPDGVPQVNATVTAGSVSRPTDADGNALLQLAQNLYPVVAYKQGFVPASTNIDVSAISTPQNPQLVDLTLVPLQPGQAQPPTPPSVPYYGAGQGVQPPVSGGAVSPGGGTPPVTAHAGGGGNTLLLGLAALVAAAITFAPEDLLA